MSGRICCLVVALLPWSPSSATALDQVTLIRDATRQHLEGQVQVEAQDGGLLLLARDGRLWILQPDEIAARASDAKPFMPLTRDEIAAQLLEEMPAGFRIHQTAHYVICYNTTPAYAEWCGALYERLFRGFFSYWQNRGFPLEEPHFPLVALVFDSQRSYAVHAERELGEATRSIIGYYNMRTNRVTMYDLTGTDELQRGRSRATTAARINQILSQPAAERTVATIVHEATHQLAYNTGLQTRYADNPLWVSEGIAVYFESPDLASSQGWRTIGAVNRLHLLQFRKGLKTRPPDSLKTLVQDDRRFREAESVASAYAEAWALNYFLLRTRRSEYVEYLRQLASQKVLVERDAEHRLAQFTAAFGDLTQLDGEFLRYVRRVR